MYYDIVENLELPITLTSQTVKELFTKNMGFYAKLHDGTEIKLFELSESLLRQEFEAICRLVYDRVVQRDNKEKK